MDKDQSEAGQELASEQDRTPEQVRDEIEQTRVELGGTVAALAEKADVKGQAEQAVNEAKATVASKKDEFVSSVRESTPESASDAGRWFSAFAREHSLWVATVTAFGSGVLIGRRRR